MAWTEAARAAAAETRRRNASGKLRQAHTHSKKSLSAIQKAGGSLGKGDASASFRKQLAARLMALRKKDGGADAGRHGVLSTSARLSTMARNNTRKMIGRLPNAKGGY